MKPMGTKRWFAWRPVRLSYHDGRHWCGTRRWAWLRVVSRTHTFWGETFYSEPGA